MKKRSFSERSKIVSPTYGARWRFKELFVLSFARTVADQERVLGFARTPSLSPVFKYQMEMK